ncbi:50S ribosomal protein L11 methyltransferase [Acidaminobacter hydrogenoformans]|uniref:Ribosomal protein L11 methyltransferase n=1 Tax=Acidaminobacter hydrogenoformans DSM 2784 TaxID=1120920 RepID=A0A1G5RSV2_9FIRM|nr:50S ribosomal protein L11 methyltransferase [Acidaminobacter hydrogenoformans]SCZ77163.1 ribosomal protein L11 methyltransferase [Acidaminobacter hydrogenoformans DSM 2784]
MKWFEVKVKTTSIAVDAVTNILYELDAQGIVVEDPNDPIFNEGYEGDWDYFDKSEIKFEFEGALVKAYVESDAPEALVPVIRAQVEGLKSFGLDPGLAEVEIKEIRESDWANEWKKYYHPVRIGRHLIIKPSWESFEQEPLDLVIELDPGGAFGSGTHETTTMCAEFLEENVEPGDKVYDIGCGSGILAIAAAKLGAGEVVAADIDPAAVAVTRENIEANQVTEVVQVYEGDLMQVVSSPADFVVTNIIADVVAHLAGSMKAYLRPGAVWISSGILDKKLPMVLEAMNDGGFEILEVRERGEWRALMVRAADHA